MINMLILDVDGVLTDGTLYYTADGEVMKGFNAHDGYGLALLQKAGMKVAIISGRRSPALERRLDDLEIYRRFLGCKDKAAAIKAIADDTATPFADMAFMGDDLLDWPAMKLAGLKIAPASAVAAIRERADLVTVAAGGAGAVREAVEYIFEKAGIDILSLAGGDLSQ